ncbi:methyltransferase [Streptomyces sp. Je 1-79]|uniref:HemK2/MTQ2 family protein methyltransferase n=1 Tax=Streptomyces sp. Je 1-79 TaxID=2943847 RepID=UPI0021A78D82|nr:HemK2/MTQ2 family protein methyltransferase [Streptomyces sp. Je 1-79]MCT4353087.1 methyltransferase [Streptomyces sp. Je 1-79]
MTSTALSTRSVHERLVALPGVYRPQADTRLLADALRRESLGPEHHVVEIGTGTGALALCAAATGAQVTAIDVSLSAVIAARINALRQGLSLRVLHGDFAARTRGRRFDLVLANPPYVPSPHGPPPSRGAARAWDAGPDGREVIDRICERAPSLLNPGGVLLLVHSGMNGAATTVQRLRGAGLPARVTLRTVVPWGPVLRSRRAWLESQGYAGGVEDREELVIIRARRP